MQPLILTHLPQQISKVQHDFQAWGGRSCRGVFVPLRFLRVLHIPMTL